MYTNFLQTTTSNQSNSFNQQQITSNSQHNHSYHNSSPYYHQGQHEVYCPQGYGLDPYQQQATHWPQQGGVEQPLYVNDHDPSGYYEVPVRPFSVTLPTDVIPEGTTYYPQPMAYFVDHATVAAFEQQQYEQQHCE